MIRTTYSNLNKVFLWRNAATLCAGTECRFDTASVKFSFCIVRTPFHFCCLQISRGRLSLLAVNKTKH